MIATAPIDDTSVTSLLAFEKYLADPTDPKYSIEHRLSVLKRRQEAHPLAADRSKHPFVYSHFLFARGLAEFRQGQFDRAISTLRGDSSRVLGPAPRLVSAMALHRQGRKTEAGKSLAAAVTAYDWRAALTGSQDAWIFHVLRREAEAMILPNLSAFLAGKHRPQDTEERLVVTAKARRHWMKRHDAADAT